MATDNCGGPGCGNVIFCGTCTPPETCGGGGTPNVCGKPCQPTTCAAAGYACGPLWDGCGAFLDCGACAGGAVCGAGGTPGKCSACASATCVPQTCVDIPPPPPPPGCLTMDVGPVSDGCGNEIQCGLGGCGACFPLAGCCGATTDPPGANYWLDCIVGCVPKTCAERGICCGQIGDGCGDILDCGPCGPDAGPPGCEVCVPKTCAQLGFACGAHDDGCGGTIDCGGCDPCVVCKGGMCAGTLVAMCVPKTCAGQGIECGMATDGCCGPLDCGTCPAPLSCRQGKCLPPCM
jgi:hypothetical protein